MIQYAAWVLVSDINIIESLITWQPKWIPVLTHPTVTISNYSKTSKTARANCNDWWVILWRDNSSVLPCSLPCGRGWSEQKAVDGVVFFHLAAFFKFVSSVNTWFTRWMFHLSWASIRQTTRLTVVFPVPPTHPGLWSRPCAQRCWQVEMEKGQTQSGDTCLEAEHRLVTYCWLENL